MSRLVRCRTLYHDRREGRNWLSCLRHGPQVGPVSQQAAEDGHGRTFCSVCDAEVQATRLAGEVVR